jgi:hypothetical protein
LIVIRDVRRRLLSGSEGSPKLRRVQRLSQGALAKKIRSTPTACCSVAISPRRVYAMIQASELALFGQNHRPNFLGIR